MAGLFVTFEGTEGAGKSTQVGLLAAALRARGLPVVATREPGGTPFGTALRSLLLDPAARGLDPLAELFLYLADRADHVGAVLLPELGRGRVVLCDRFADATVAYQGHGRGLELELVRRANDGATRGLRPDLTFLIDLGDVAAGVGRARRRQREDGSAGHADRFEQEELAFHERVRDGYRALAAAEPGRFVLLRGEEEPGRIHERILGAVLEALARKEGAGR